MEEERLHGQWLKMSIALDSPKEQDIPKVEVAEIPPDLQDDDILSGKV